jgi:hypothetical protein
MQIWSDNHRVPGLQHGSRAVLADRAMPAVHAVLAVRAVLADRAMPAVRAVLAALAVLVVACGALACGPSARADQPPKPAEPAIAWHQLGQWSGRGNRQTESFTSDTGALRLRWETTSQTGDPAAASGTFHVTAHSAISGRPLQEVVDHTGVGSGVGYVQQDPHVFYVVVDSTHVNWTFTVEEAVAYR